MGKKVVTLRVIATFEKEVKMVVGEDDWPVSAINAYWEGDEPLEQSEWVYVQTDFVDTADVPVIDYEEEG